MNIGPALKAMLVNLAVPGGEHVDESWCVVEICAHTLQDPRLQRARGRVLLDGAPDFCLHAQQREHEAQTSLLQYLHHTLLAPINLCSYKQQYFQFSKN